MEDWKYARLVDLQKTTMRRFEHLCIEFHKGEGKHDPRLPPEHQSTNSGSDFIPNSLLHSETHIYLNEVA